MVTVLRVAHDIGRIVSALNDSGLMKQWLEYPYPPEILHEAQLILDNVEKRLACGERDYWIELVEENQGNHVYLNLTQLRNREYFIEHCYENRKGYALIPKNEYWQVSRNAPSSPYDSGPHFYQSMLAGDLVDYARGIEREIEGIKGVLTVPTEAIFIRLSDGTFLTLPQFYQQRMEHYDHLAYQGIDAQFETGEISEYINELEIEDEYQITEDELEIEDEYQITEDELEIEDEYQITEDEVDIGYDDKDDTEEKTIIQRRDGDEEEIDNAHKTKLTLRLPDYTKLREDVLESDYPVDQVLTLYLIGRAQDGDREAAARIAYAYYPSWARSANKCYYNYQFGKNGAYGLEDIHGIAIDVCIAFIMGNSLNTLKANLGIIKGREESRKKGKKPSPFPINTLATTLTPEALEDNYLMNRDELPEVNLLAILIYLTNRFYGVLPSNTDIESLNEHKPIPYFLHSLNQLSVREDCEFVLLQSCIAEIVSAEGEWQNCRRFNPALGGWDIEKLLQRKVKDTLWRIRERHSTTEERYRPICGDLCFEWTSSSGEPCANRNPGERCEHSKHKWVAHASLETSLDEPSKVWKKTSSTFEEVSLHSTLSSQNQLDDDIDELDIADYNKLDTSSLIGLDLIIRALVPTLNEPEKAVFSSRLDLVLESGEEPTQKEVAGRTNLNQGTISRIMGEIEGKLLDIVTQIENAGTYHDILFPDNYMGDSIEAEIIRKVDHLINKMHAKYLQNIYQTDAYWPKLFSDNNIEGPIRKINKYGFIDLTPHNAVHLIIFGLVTKDLHKIGSIQKCFACACETTSEMCPRCSGFVFPFDATASQNIRLQKSNVFCKPTRKHKHAKKITVKTPGE